MDPPMQTGAECVGQDRGDFGAEDLHPESFVQMRIGIRIAISGDFDPCRMTRV